jgi:hypothetical protein
MNGKKHVEYNREYAPRGIKILTFTGFSEFGAFRALLKTPNIGDKFAPFHPSNTIA